MTRLDRTTQKTRMAVVAGFPGLDFGSPEDDKP
jgi:hypothetical protein